MTWKISNSEIRENSIVLPYHQPLFFLIYIWIIAQDGISLTESVHGAK